MQKVLCHPFPEGTRAPKVCRHTVSGSLSLPSQGCFSPFPHGTCSLSVAEEYLALRGGPIAQVLSTGLLPSMARLSSPVPLSSLYDPCVLHRTSKDPATPIQQRCNAYTYMGLGCSPFARRYSGNRSFFLFLWVLRCFSSPRSPP